MHDPAVRDEAEENFSIEVTDWSTDRNELSQIRRQVFIEEQDVPEDLEWDELDESSTHFIVTDHKKPIACARLTTAGQIGRMAVLSEYRGRGIGSRLLQAVLQAAQQRDLPDVYLHAQVSAIPFYVRHGFTCRGETFSEAGIAHREMIKDPAI
ncbi:MAG: GNAT family N-acetyltransferase [Proteobacteria bacterium]|nr:GNAT family N-acetyltransferase [Pseudomonadota bacterium]